MKTLIGLDDDLLSRTIERTGAKTEKAAVNTVMSEYIRMKKRDELTAMEGKAEYGTDQEEPGESRKDD